MTTNHNQILDALKTLSRVIPPTITSEVVKSLEQELEPGELELLQNLASLFEQKTQPEANCTIFINAGSMTTNGLNFGSTIENPTLISINEELTSEAIAGKLSDALSLTKEHWEDPAKLQGAIQIFVQSIVDKHIKKREPTNSSSKKEPV